MQRDGSKKMRRFKGVELPRLHIMKERDLI